ncbi:hypothetical protein VPH35_063003 [Triticum aestivum]
MAAVRRRRWSSEGSRWRTCCWCSTRRSRRSDSPPGGTSSRGSPAATSILRCPPSLLLLGLISAVSFCCLDFEFPCVYLTSFFPSFPANNINPSTKVNYTHPRTSRSEKSEAHTKLFRCTWLFDYFPSYIEGELSLYGDIYTLYGEKISNSTKSQTILKIFLK